MAGASKTWRTHFTRVLPVEASIRICRELGYGGRHIIAMQGPFSEEIELCQLKEFIVLHGNKRRGRYRRL